MKEEIGKLTETVVRSGQAVISGLKSETDKLIDEAVAQMDDKKKKTWSGYDSIQLKEAPDTIVPGCLVLEGGSFRGCYTSGVLDVLMENGISMRVVSALVAISKVEGESYEDYIKKVRSNPDATFVKKHDTLCNLTQSLREGNSKRIKKYAKQLLLLEE